MAPLSKPPCRLSTLGTLIGCLGIFLAFSHQLAVAQYYCNGRAAITQQWGGCNGTEAVCSSLMQAITQTWNWWATVNNTAGNSIGVAAHNFFTTDAYTEMLSFTNNNTAYPSVCTKIAKIVAQLLLWNQTKSANVLLGNATCVATARQEMFCTVIPGWGYTIGDYIACGPTCTNYSANATGTPNNTCPISTICTTGSTTTKTPTTSTSTTSISTTTKTPTTTSTTTKTPTTTTTPSSAASSTATATTPSGGGGCKWTYTPENSCDIFLSIS